MKWIIFIITVCFLVGCSRQSFDSVKWKEWKETESTMFMRRDMVSDLTKQHNLVGKKRAEIIDLLGKPTSENKVSMSYDLGPTGHGINYGSLALSIDENDDVEKYKITEH